MMKDVLKASVANSLINEIQNLTTDHDEKKLD